jgi:VanZ family protein
MEIADLGEFRATIGHALAYAGLGAVAVFAQRRPRLGLTLAMVIGYGVALEGLQGGIGLRSFQWTDIAANSLGALTGVAVAARVGRSLP